jgi:hypothetical protein
MRRLDRERRAIPLERYRARRASDADCSEVIAEPFQLYEHGALKIAYLELGEHPTDGPVLETIYRAVARVHFQKSARTGGLVTTSRTFGYLPRVTIRRDYCTATSLSAEQPAEHAAVAHGAALVGRWYRELNPDLYAEHARVATARPSTCWSGMLVFRDGVAGGMLALPEFDLAVALKHKGLFFFDGQGILHGVTPMQLLRPTAKRYSLVYYSMKGMWQCEPLGAEVARIRRLRVDREARRAATAPRGGGS